MGVPVHQILRWPAWEIGIWVDVFKEEAEAAHAAEQRAKVEAALARRR